MNFNSYAFLLFLLPLSLAGYFMLNRYNRYKAAQIYLVACSLCFFGWFNVYSLICFVADIAVNYLASKLLLRQASKTAQKITLAIALILNISFLGYFKYCNFFLDTLTKASGNYYEPLNIIVPLGISFYTFQQIAYLVDTYRGETEDITLCEYLVFMTFFPQLVQGPIMLHGDFIPSLREEANKKINYENMMKGLYAFSLGLAKKVLIADTLAVIASAGFDNVRFITRSDAWLAAISFSLQLYFDFSGYCDMALGISRMFNLSIPLNFNSPYKGASIAEFWDRWHMSLTRFFTRYIYIPLGGSRRGIIRTYVNILIIFFISGLWHGADWSFVIWGVMNGIAMVLYRVFKKPWDAFSRRVRFLAVGITFIFDTLAWVMFRAKDFFYGTYMYFRLLDGHWHRIASIMTEAFYSVFEFEILRKLDVFGITAKVPELMPILFVICILIATFTMKNTQEKLEEYKPTVWKISVTIILLVWCLVSFGKVTVFLYNNF